MSLNECDNFGTGRFLRSLRSVEMTGRSSDDREMVLCTEICRETARSSGRTPDPGVRAPVCGMRDSEVQQGQETPIRRFSRDKKLQYEKDMITERDYRNILETARENGFAAGLAEGEVKGHAAGIAEGEAKGKAERTTEVARTMLSMGLSDEVILQATGLSVAELASLKEN